MSRITVVHLAIFLLFCVASAAVSADQADTKLSVYEGQEQRWIKSLSEDDVRQLQQGKGWGLAKAAELNGLPGPVHILELQQQLDLTQEQIDQISALYQQMLDQAVPLGKQLVNLEQALDVAFVNQSISREQLEQQLDAIYRVLSKLRFVHLSAHLATPEVLDQAQIDRYQELRGYGDRDPCSFVPAGHDSRLWRQHNNCGQQAGSG